MSTSMGLVGISRMYARGGMIHFLVGNSCPGIYKMPGGTLRVATHGNAKGGRRVGSVVTDLWWVCGMDHDWYMRRCKEQKQTPDPSAIVPVQKGVWAFKFDPNKHCEFTHCNARWVGKVVKDPEFDHAWMPASARQRNAIMK